MFNCCHYTKLKETVIADVKLEMMRPLTSVLTVSHVNNNRDFTIQRRDVNYSLNFIRLLRIVITPSTRTSHKK